MAAEVFGPYRLEELIGRGGMGEVYRAFDTARKRVVALKRLSPHLATDPEYQARFRAESEMAARLRSAHVIPIHDYGEIDGVLFIDMRLVDGVDLATRLEQRGVLPPAEAVQVIGQVANALDAAHASGLVHRDVKPSNILLSDTDGEGPGFAYLVDFGIARAVDGTGGLTGTGSVVGSVDYMAPERFEARPTDRRVDVYALACVVFEALTGTKPFATTSLAAALYSHVHTPPPRPSERRPSVSPAFDPVVLRGMAKDPRQRFATAGELAAAARAAVAAPVYARGPSVPVPQRPRYPGPTRPQTFPPRYGGTHSAALPVPGSGPHAPPAGSGPHAAPAPGSGPHAAPAPGSGPHARPAARPAASARWRWFAPLGAVLAAGGIIWAVLAATANPDPGSAPPSAAASASSTAPVLAQPGPPRTARVVENLPLNATTGIAIDPSGSRFYLTGPGDGTDGAGFTREVHAYEFGNAAPVGVLDLSDVAVGGLALAPDGRRLYVTTWVVADDGRPQTSSLSVIDPTGASLVATVPLSNRPGPVAVAPGGDRVYVGVGNGIEVIDPVAARSLAVIPVGGSVEGLAVSPDGRVLSAGPSGVKIVDPASNAVVSTVALRDDPAGIAVTPDGRRAVVAASDAGAIAYVDLDTMTVTGGVAVGEQPETVVVTPDGRQALVANYDTGSVSVVDLATDAVSQLNVGDSPEAIAVSQDGPDGIVGLVVTSSNVVRFELVES